MNHRRCGHVKSSIHRKISLRESHPMSGTDYLVEVLTDFCENPPVVSRSESGATINCLWLPSELNHEWELRFSCTIATRGGCDVVMSIDFSAPASVQKVEDFLAELRDRINLPFYLMTIDHARMFVKRTIWREMEEEGWAEPPTWSCPVTFKDSGSAAASGVAAQSADCSEFSDKRYLKHIEWLDIPPSFPGTVIHPKCHTFPLWFNSCPHRSRGASMRDSRTIFQ